MAALPAALLRVVGWNPQSVHHERAQEISDELAYQDIIIATGTMRKGLEPTADKLKKRS